MVKKVLYSHLVDMGGIPLRQPLPTTNVEHIDPFLLLHHHIGHFEEGTSPRDVGVGPHPHRGFSPVTFIFQGDVHHRDSRDNSSVVKAGGVQWMNAGMGIVHSERPSAQLTRDGGTQEIIQLWINTPQSKKMKPPAYQAFQKEELPIAKNGLSLVAGNEDDSKGPALTEMPVKAMMGILDAGQKVSISVDYAHSFLYLLEGRVSIEQFGLLDEHNLVWLEEDANELLIEIKETSKLLFLSADPLNEPLATYGPFVMNNQTEIMEAMRDYQMGKMGVLIEEF
ncbi:MAG: pirin family protein [Bacteroidota bacterium]